MFKLGDNNSEVRAFRKQMAQIVLRAQSFKHWQTNSPVNNVSTDERTEQETAEIHGRRDRRKYDVVTDQVPL